MKKIAGELGFLILVGISVIGAVVVRAVAEIEDIREAYTRR